MIAMNIRGNIFFTRNRRLEQFLFMHGIRFQGYHKDMEGMTVWTYEATSELRRVIAEWEEVQCRKERMRI